MTFEEFDKFQNELFAECIKMRNTKGSEYANSTSRFANFDRLAVELDLTNAQVGWVYAKKHLDSIAQALRTKKYDGRSEALYGRFVDAITYLSLIAGMVHESMQPKEKSNIVASNLDLVQCARCHLTFIAGETIWGDGNGNYSHTTCPSERGAAKAASA